MKQSQPDHRAGKGEPLSTGFAGVESVRTEKVGHLNVDVHRILTTDRAVVALSRVGRRPLNGPAIILAPGTFANREFWLSPKGRGLSAYLHESGFDCWVYEWREHGRSKNRGVKKDRSTFDTLIEYDVGAVLRYVSGMKGHRGIFWIGHSAGGTLIYGHLARNPDAQDILGGLITIGTQTTHCARSLLNRARCRLSFPMIRLLGYFPARALGLGPEDELGQLVRQWARWNLAGSWNGLDGFDYLGGLGKIHLPALVLAGGGDFQLAPEAGCRVLFDSLGSREKEFRLLSRSTGYRVDYDHNELVIGPAAQDEVWPMIRSWLEERAPSSQARGT